MYQHKRISRPSTIALSIFTLLALLIPIATHSIWMPQQTIGIAKADQSAAQLINSPASTIAPAAGSGRTLFLPIVRGNQATVANTPASLAIEQDDRNAILTWDGGPLLPDQQLPAGVVGYRVTWGPVAKPDAFVKLTEERILQLQPLENGQPYVARVQSVDSMGNVSAQSNPIRFTGDPKRVDTLRARMNGFFDDFNMAEGAPDELKWNSAYSRCNAASSNGFFINNQFHAHNTVFTGNCDRGQSISRPRAQLDFSDNGTRTIVFDFDGEFRRDQWYLDLVPRLMDISGQVSIEAGEDAHADPANGLRFHQTEQGVNIIAFTPQGGERVLAQMDWKPYQPLDWAGLKLISNVRRHWEIHLSRDYAEVLINGKKVLATQTGAFHLSEDRYTLLWNVFSYNTNKSNEPVVLAHWDNFGFDAPSGTRSSTATHNYRLVNNGTDFTHAFAWDNSSPATVTLNIPDQVSGATARRLLFTLQMDGNNWYKWNPADKVSVNGHDFPIQQPASNAQPPLALDQLVSTISPFTMVIPLPEGVLKQGGNTVTFTTESSSFHNIHVELDFPTAAAPSYTPPAQVIAGQLMPASLAIGPNAVITQIGDTTVDTWGDTLNDPSRFNPKVSGVTPIAIDVRNEVAMHGAGSNTGIVQVELVVDGKIVQLQRTDALSPAPAVVYTFKLDTRQFADGVHEIYVRAYNPGCTASIPDYGGAGSQSGHYYPIHITTANGITKAPAPTNVDLSKAACQGSSVLVTMNHQH